jgi:phosphatidylinositol kinase/protein kinase (PI-3  family)
MGITGVEGTFRTACEETLRLLRQEQYMLLTILDVFRFDPLYRWSVSPIVKRKRSDPDETMNGNEDALVDPSSTGNKEAARALLGYVTFCGRSIHDSLRRGLFLGIGSRRSF